MKQISPRAFDVVAHNFVHSGGRRVTRETPEVDIPEELLVVRAIKISDNFGTRSSQVQSRENAANNLEKNHNTKVSCLTVHHSHSSNVCASVNDHGN